MSVQTKPSGYGTYKCEFIAHLSQGEATPLTVRVERPRSEQTKCCLYINAIFFTCGYFVFASRARCPRGCCRPS